MNNRLALMILLYSAVCYAPDSNKFDNVYEEQDDLCGPCTWTEYFLGIMYLDNCQQYYNVSIKEFKSAIKERDIKKARIVICRRRNYLNPTLMKKYLKKSIKKGLPKFIELLVRNGAMSNKCDEIEIIDLFIKHQDKYKNPDDLLKQVFFKNGFGLKFLKIVKSNNTYNEQEKELVQAMEKHSKKYMQKEIEEKKQKRAKS